MKQILINAFAREISRGLVLPDIMTLVEIIEDAPAALVDALEKIAAMSGKQREGEG